MQQYVQTHHGLKRSRSTSPGNEPLQLKRRVPPNYVPSMYPAPLPTHVTAHSSSAVRGSPSPSLSASDWVHKTEELHLNTPPEPPPIRGDSAGVPATDYGWDQGRLSGTNHDMDMDAMDADEDDAHSTMNHLHVEHPRSATDFLHHSHPRFTPSSHPQYTSDSAASATMPHHAPPLHMNLAGSPQATPTGMSRSSSSSSDSSLAASPNHHQHQHSHLQRDSRNRSTDRYQHSAAVVPSLHGNEVAMTVQPSPQSQSQRRTGGWKVTFGYRADCQKCLDRVPGHYSHLVNEVEGLMKG